MQTQPKKSEASTTTTMLNASYPTVENDNDTTIVSSHLRIKPVASEELALASVLPDPVSLGDVTIPASADESAPPQEPEEAQLLDLPGQVSAAAALVAPDIDPLSPGAIIKPRETDLQPKELVRKWPSTLMKLMNENDDDEWEPVMERIRTHADEIVIQGINGGQNALHAACIRYPPTHVVAAILAAKPQAALYQNFSGETPLHLASYSASEEVQALLVRAAPAAVSAQDKYGDCPLHFAARSGATYTLMEQLLSAAPTCVSLRNKRGVTPFWLLPRSYLEAENLEEIFDDDDDADDYRDDWELLLLLLRYAYFGADRPAPTRDNGELSYDWIVHAAAATPACPRETLKFLCHLFPEQAVRYNEKGYTPLLLAIQALDMEEPENWDENEDGFRENVDAAEVTLADAAQEGLPVEATVSQHVDTEYLQRALQKDTTQDENAESVISILLEWNPLAIVYGDSKGTMPLAHALLAGKSWQVVRRLIQACPRALESRDRSSGGLFMFQLAAMMSPDIDTVFTIARSLPELIAMTRRFAQVAQPGENPIKKKARVDDSYEMAE
jgi:hypothetical protein